MGSQVNLTLSLVFIALFSIAIMAFAISFANENSAPISVVNDPEISGLYTNLSGNVQNYSTAAGSTASAIMNSSINTQSGTVESVGAFAITPLSLISAVTNIIRVGYIKIFGSGSVFGIFLTAFGAILVFLMVMYIWKTAAGRTPD